jgi:hypothetical protein
MIITSHLAGAAVTVTPAQENESALVRYSYAVPVTTLAYTEVVAAVASALKGLDIVDTSGQTMVVAFGALGAEVDQFYIIPGGQNFPIRKAIPAGTRITIKAVSATADEGEFTANGIA